MSLTADPIHNGEREDEPKMNDSESLYLILYNKRGSDLALWWRPNSSGYTTNLNDAGRYSKGEAESIARIRGEDTPVCESILGNGLQIRNVINMEDGDNFKVLKRLQEGVQK